MTQASNEPPTVSVFVEGLRERLGPAYLPPVGQGGHDTQHVLRMVGMYIELSTLIGGVDRDVYEVTVWLHNVDRYKNLIQGKPLGVVLEEMLTESGLEKAVRQRIIQAVQEHGKRHDDTGDSPLLRMLRLADKWDRIGVMGATSGFAWKGNELSSYDPEHPFGYGSTAEGQWKTLYQNFYRILEWYVDFPLIREMVKRHPRRLDHFLMFVRAFAEEVAEAHGVVNKVEDDIRKCLGSYYGDWAPRQ